MDNPTFQFGKPEEKIINNALERIKSNTRSAKSGGKTKRKPTLSEAGLTLFLKRGAKGVKFARLRKTVKKHSSAADIHTATRKLIMILRNKVETEGGELVGISTPKGSRKYWIVCPPGPSGRKFRPPS